MKLGKNLATCVCKQWNNKYNRVLIHRSIPCVNMAMAQAPQAQYREW